MKRGFRIILSITSGVLLSLAWLGFPGWVLFIAFLPLLLLDDFFVREKASFRSVSFFGQTYLAFIVWNILATWWVKHASPEGAIAAIFLNSFLMALTWWLAHAARRKFAKDLGYLALVVFYLSFEYCHYHWEIEWPWITLGNGFANNVKLVQWYEFTGVFGGSLWVLMVNVIIFKLLKQLVSDERNKLFYVGAGSLLLLVFIPIIYSQIIYSNYKERENPREIVIVQPNVDPYSESYSVAAENEKLQKFISLAARVTGDSTDFIVGPETVFERYPDWEESRFHFLPNYQKLWGFISKYKKAELVIGISSSKVYQPGEKPPVTARKSNNVTFDVYNAALFINRKGESQVYHKSILVPGVEKMPYIKYLGFLNKIVINLGGTSGSLGRQDEPTNFTASDSTVIAPVICYESIFGEYLNGFIKRGAQTIFIITNDGWWKDTPGYKQHLSFARLRAIETRRSIARSANTGISCFINQRGDVSQKTTWWHEAVIKGQINANDKLTFYVKNGDYIPRVAVFLSILLILLLIAEKLKRKG